MGEYLDKLRAKPLHQRKQIATVSTGVIFSIIFAVWWITFTSPVNSESVATTAVISPLGVLANVAAATKEGIYALPAKMMKDMNLTATGTAQNGGVTGDIVYPSQLNLGVTPESAPPQEVLEVATTTSTASPQLGQ